MTSISNVTPTTQITITPENGKDGTTQFFGPNGPSFGDVVDAINPLNNIPVISDLINGDSADKPSVASKLAGGLLYGGPIGFAASLINEIFTEATGHGVAGSVVAALSGDSTTQVASAAGASGTQTAQNDITDDNDTPGQLADASDAIAAQTNANAAGATATADAARNKALLDLYGASAPASASRSYQKAQLLPYLRESNTNQVL